MLKKILFISLIAFNLTSFAEGYFGAREHDVNNTVNDVFDVSIAIRKYSGLDTRIMDVKKGESQHFDNDGPKYYSGDKVTFSFTDDSGQSMQIDTTLPVHEKSVENHVAWEEHTIHTLISTSGTGYIGMKSAYVYNITVE